ncbi:flagellar basal-body rod protein FlgG [candidate division KSB1 bacterium]|nr:flagellar basal-body rod protein FlgG [candidate division KSB1 bacterium]
MMRGMYSSATGMYAQELYIDMIANNLANVNTSGFKKSRIEFQDLLYETLRNAGPPNSQGVVSPIELQIGHGTRPVAVQKLFNQGTLVNTYNPLDLAVKGDGFFQVTQVDGTMAYTRDGSFKLSAEGKIVTSDGYTLEPELIIPQDATEVSISADGTVSVLMQGENSSEEIGQIELVRFINPAALTNMGQNVFRANENSGDPIIGTPGLEGLGTLEQGYVEQSNVEVVEEMVNMIAAQRAYEINSKAIRTAHDMLSIANNLVR